MGVIIKESAKQTVVRIGLSVLGAVATLFIYPLNRELYGILGFILDASLLLMPAILVGVGESSIKFFPFKNTDHTSRKDFLNFLIKLLFLNIVIVSVLFYFLKDFFIAWAANPSNDYSEYFIYILPAAICFGVTQFFVKYISNYKIVTLPVFVQSLFRIAMPLAFILVFYNLMDRIGGIHLLIASLVLGAVVMAIITYHALNKNQESQDSRSDPVSNKSFFSFYFWSFATSVGSLMAFKIDGYMVPTLTNFEAGGDYRMSVFIASIIALPITSVVAISSPILSQAWKDHDMKEIKDVYLKGSKNLVYIGAVMLLAILMLVDLLPQILDSWKELTHLKALIVIIGIAKLVDMTAGVNGVIIQHSPWYRYNTIFVLIMMVINIVLNLILIREYHIIGAAIATAISLIVFNIMKAVLLQRKIKLNPFDGPTLLFLVVLAIVFVVMQFVLRSFPFPIAFVINGILILIFAAYYLFRTNLALETKSTVLRILKRL